MRYCGEGGNSRDYEVKFGVECDREVNSLHSTVARSYSAVPVHCGVGVRAPRTNY
jgi:hypothetical protein